VQRPDDGPETSKLSKQSLDSVPKLRPSISKPTKNASGNSSSLRSVQRTGTTKRQHSPAPSWFHAGRKDLLKSKPLKHCCMKSSPASTPPAPIKTKENEIRVVSSINISDKTAGSPRLSPRAPSSAPDTRICGNISSTGESRESATSRKSVTSLPVLRIV